MKKKPLDEYFNVYILHNCVVNAIKFLLIMAIIKFLIF